MVGILLELPYFPPTDRVVSLPIRTPRTFLHASHNIREREKGVTSEKLSDILPNFFPLVAQLNPFSFSSLIALKVRDAPGMIIT